VRARLVERVERSTQSRFTVIAAPAGYGKTVLVDQWSAQHSNATVATVRFSPGDERRRAITRVRAAIAQLCTDGRNGAPAVPGGPSLEVLIGALERVGPVVLVLDGVDGPGPDFTAQDLAPLVQHAPSTTHFVVTERSRRAHASMIPEWRSIATVTERELAFTQDEASLLVEEVSGRQLTDDQLETLLDTTGGWGAGLALAAAGLRAATDADGYIRSFTGCDRQVAAFFRHEVLSRETAAARRVLTLTSPLRSIVPALATAVTGEAGAGAWLESIERRGLFVARLRGSGHRYVYHPMFREFLRHELSADADTERAVLLRAAGWYAARRQPEPAARCLIDAREWLELVALVDRWGPIMLDDGRGQTLLDWLAAVPGWADDEDIDLALRSASILTAVGSLRRAAQAIDGIEPLPLSPRQRLSIDVLRATLLFLGSSNDVALPAVQAARAAVESAEAPDRPDAVGIPSPSALTTMAAVMRARLRAFAGDIPGARQLLSPLAERPGAALREQLQATSTLAVVEAWGGNLDAAASHAGRAIALARSAGLARHPLTVEAIVALAHVLRERGALDSAAEALNDLYHSTVGLTHPTLSGLYTLEQARWYLATEQPKQGLALIDRSRDAGLPFGPPPLVASIRAVEAQLLVTLGRADRAEAVLDEALKGPRIAELKAARVQVALARGDHLEAATRLKAWAVDEPGPSERLLHDLWATIVEFEGGRRRHALEKAKALLSSAEPEGHVRLFLDAGPPAERLLRALVHADPSPYLHAILHVSRASRTAVASTLGLSKRELEVIRYLPTQLSSSEIGARLYISLNTVKSHLQAIYTKLGVTGRRQAIEQAQQLGLA
jgi:LuxR family maltose regulon positive regulatory protein